MTDERRYTDEEVAAILEAAARAPQPEGGSPAPAVGLALTDLRPIGAAVGIAPERITEAAEALELRRGGDRRGKHLGMPVTVGRTATLPRAPTDREWEVLVAELRETFGAHGRDVSQGGVRGWRNGNLHAYVEPTEAGYRLRLGTTKRDATAMANMGAAGVAMGLIMLAVLLVTTGGAAGAEPALMFASMGAALLTVNALRLPAWASEREAQMEHVAARARALIRPA